MLGACGAAMASDKDDLEHELRHNLKLRRKLGAQAGKAEAAISGKKGGGIAYRLGWLLYLACLGLAGAFAADLAFLLLTQGGDPNYYWVPAVFALILYGLGRGFRYVLSGS
jgi:hypothetical protein